MTYGAFALNERGDEFPEPAEVEADLARMTEAGINAIRTYTVPPQWFLDLAADRRIRVLVGIPWEEHVAFLDESGMGDRIEATIRAAVHDCARHPAVLAFAIGNEIPASIVRWHGRRRIEAFLERLYWAAKDEDPEALVTYVSYPSTEYLRLPFLDFACFNVYLEDRDEFESYLARLHNVVGEKPLILSEVGLDSGRFGEEAQAASLDWQLRDAFHGGCAGTFVFSWTDTWHRGGEDVTDWQFGLVDADRRAKAALEEVARAYRELPFKNGMRWPRVSVVVCSRDGSRTLRECLEGIVALDYPDFELIVVDDGSVDNSRQIAEEYADLVISTPNRGLSAARNTGVEAATGEIVAYLDDDAWPDRYWLRYLAMTFARDDYAGVGGPNIAPPGDGAVAECVANSPGRPVHVLLSDREAEHIPGCNMAFRKECLESVDGFDPQFRIAGDDVDVCWRLQDFGWTLGYSPAALVWHRQRRSVTAYLRQQRDYGRAEALLERKWPEKYNAFGHVSWAGRLYGGVPSLRMRLRRARIRYGIWGTGAFQTSDEPEISTASALTGMPEWYLVIGALAATAALGALWMPLLAAIPLLLVAVALLIAHAVAGGLRGRYTKTTRRQRWRLRALTAGLYVAQPLARLWGRAGYGLTPWRRRGPRGVAFPGPRQRQLWSEAWQAPEKRLKELTAHLSRDGAVVRHGGAKDRWDLEVRGGGCAATRTLMAVEEHGSGRQLVRFRTWPTAFPLAIVALALLAVLAVWAGLDGATAAAAVLGGLAGLVLLATLKESATATASLLRGFERLDRAQRDRVEADRVEAEENGRALAPVSRLDTVRSTDEASQPPRRARVYR